MLVWNEKSIVDDNAKSSLNPKGRLTNYIEVLEQSQPALSDFLSKFNPDLSKDDLESLESPKLGKVKSMVNNVLISADLQGKTGPVFKKMQTITEFDDLSLIDKMKRH